MRNKTLKKTLATALLFAFAIGSLAGCGNKNISSAQAAELNQDRAIRIADQANYFTAKVALEKGFLKEEFGDDFTFELSIFENGPAINEALTAGKIDLASYGDNPAIQGYSGGVDVKIVSTLWLSDNAYALIAGPNSGIESLDDLRGKKIGYAAATTTHQLILKILDRQGISESDVTLVNIKRVEGNAAVASGELDANIAEQPFEAALEQTGGKIITTNKDYNVQPVFVLASGEFARNNPDTLSRILKAYDKANRWIYENEEEAAKIVSDINGNDIEGVKTYYKTRQWTIGWDENLTKGLNESIKFSYDNGNIPAIFDAGELVDTSFLEKAGLYKK
ncbi:MAG: ABC transporter substrate-binding protein [Lachnospiraceae bacterium]|nr:ABC transporter substrate-binding protein [Lachnospiraceae bacterium]